MIKLIKWLSHKMGYKIVMIKIGDKVSNIMIEGDKELLRYVDITGYTFKKEPLSRIKPSTLTYPKPNVKNWEPIKPLSNEELDFIKEKISIK